MIEELMTIQPVPNMGIGYRIAGRWEIQKILGGPGRSGMGVVYVVYDHDWKQVLAAKTFQNKYLVSKSARDRFLREAAVWLRFDSHPNIVRARLVELVQGKPYIFLDFVTGGDLSDWIGTPRLTLGKILRFAIQFCHGMEYALEHGIEAHRDIKPANCLISEDDTLQITDFGLASVGDAFDGASAGEFGNHNVRTGRSSTISRTGIGVGTPRYMAPEQFSDAKHVTAQADIYSFGVMLYEMVETRPLCTATSWNEWRTFHQEGVIPYIANDERRGIVDDVIRKCLQKDPRSRYPSFQSVRSDLERIMKSAMSDAVPLATFATDMTAHDLNSKGSSLNYVGRYEEARVALESALELAPRNAMILNNLGFSSWRLGRRMDALQLFDRAIALDPAHFDAISNKGVLLYELGKLCESISLGRQAVDIKPNSSVAWNNLGRRLHDAKEFAEARVCYNMALSIDPRNILTIGNIGFLLANQDFHERAIEWYDRVLATDPLHGETLNAKAMSLAALRRNDEAVACWLSAVAASPEVAVAHANLGKFYYQLGRFQEAHAKFDDALRLDPGDQEIRWLRSDVKRCVTQNL